MKCSKSNTKYLSAAAAISASLARRIYEGILTQEGLQTAFSRFGSEESKRKAILEVIQKRSLNLR